MTTCNQFQRLAKVTYTYGGLNDYKVLMTRCNIHDDSLKTVSRVHDGGEFPCTSNLTVPQSLEVIQTMGFNFEGEKADRKRAIARVELEVNRKYRSGLKMEIRNTTFTRMSSEISKYYKIRHSLFKKFDEGIQLDEESWFSVTPELLAKHIASRLKSATVIDAFCGAGGNAIQLAMVCDKVIAIDIDPKKIQMAKHNAKIYGVDHKIVFINKDFLKFVPAERKGEKADAVFVSPPWGGPGYRNKNTFSLKEVTPDIDQIMEKVKSLSKNVALFLPRNTVVEELMKYANGNPLEVEQNVINGRLKAMTVYYGNLINTTTDPIVTSSTNQNDVARRPWRTGKSPFSEQTWRTEKEVTTLEDKIALPTRNYTNFHRHNYKASNRWG